MLSDVMQFYLLDRLATPVGHAIENRLSPNQGLAEESLRLDIMDKKRRLGLPYEDDDDFEKKLNEEGDKTVETLFRKYTTRAMKSIPEPVFESKSAGQGFLGSLFGSQIPEGQLFWKEASYAPSLTTRLFGSAEHGIGSRLLSAVGKRWAKIG